MVDEWVLDCSVALAFGLPDEHSLRADSFWPEIERGAPIWVTSLWWYEITNALAVARRRQRLTGADASRLLSLFCQLPVKTDAILGAETFERIAALAWDCDLSAYDAAYLELACRRGLGLATLDQRLERAAGDLGIRVWSNRGQDP
ncbi:MAG: type II toxin-antitoxin system VapC family toxin [Myxococcota bacterium]|nr:type II toxin-antitoxin system VapC family toxin [Myxococcota bacterium]